MEQLNGADLHESSCPERCCAVAHAERARRECDFPCSEIMCFSNGKCWGVRAFVWNVDGATQRRGFPNRDECVRSRRIPFNPDPEALDEPADWDLEALAVKFAN